jgi:hypothetical protein
MQTKPFSNSPFRNARDAFLQFRMLEKVSMYYRLRDTACRFVAIFEKLGVALRARIFSPSAPTLLLRVAYPD